MTFSVQDPSLDLKIWDYNQNSDVTGKSVPQGEKLGFRIDTNMYPAVDGRYRSNVIDDSITGVWPVGYTAGDFAINNLLYNQSRGTWINGTYSILTNPTEPCCPIYADVYTERFFNYTTSGMWMTWSEVPSDATRRTPRPGSGATRPLVIRLLCSNDLQDPRLDRNCLDC